MAIQKWEYLRDVLRMHESDEVMRERGEEGWELVCVVHFQASQFSTFLFKRPKQ